MLNRYKAVNPDKLIRGLRKEFKKIQKGDPEHTTPDRLADFARRAHDQRMINKTMHVAQLCLDAAPDEGPDLLVEAYLADRNDDEDRLRAWAEVANLGRWLGNDALIERADQQARELAPVWVGAVEGGERRARLRDLGSMFDQGLADQVRTELGDS